MVWYGMVSYGMSGYGRAWQGMVWYDIRGRLSHKKRQLLDVL